MHLNIRRASCTLLILLGAGALTGCAAESDGGFLSFSPRSGQFIGEESLRRIQPGETDVEWVLAVLGRPVEREPLAGGTEEIWKYQYQFIAGSNSRSYLLNSRTEKGQNARYIYIQLASGIVSDWWRD